MTRQGGPPDPTATTDRVRSIDRSVASIDRSIDRSVGRSVVRACIICIDTYIIINIPYQYIHHRLNPLHLTPQPYTGPRAAFASFHVSSSSSRRRRRRRRRRRPTAIDDERDDDDDDPDPPRRRARRSIDRAMTTTTMDDDDDDRDAREVSSAMTPTTPTTSRGRTMMISGRMKRARLVNARWKATRSDRALGNERGEGGRDDDEGRRARRGDGDGDGDGDGLGRGDDRDDRDGGDASREEAMRKRVRFDRKFRTGIPGGGEKPRYAYEDHEAHRDRSDDEAEARAKTRTREAGDEDAVGGVGRTWEWSSEDGRRREWSSGGTRAKRPRLIYDDEADRARAASEADSDATETETETETARRRRGEEETTTARGGGRKLAELFVTRPGRKTIRRR